jgi:hypothetical protein
MSEFKEYLKSNKAEIRAITQNDIILFNNDDKLPAPFQFNISISGEDLKNGSPKIGDVVGRNPKNRLDQWLIAEKYFKENFISTEKEKTK